MGNMTMEKERITQLWLNGRVPSGYWDRASNRKAYMRWLGKEMGFRKKEDWYQISKQDFHRHYGGGLIANYYSDSPQEAVMNFFPDYPWKCWLFRSTPQGYWKDKSNRREYMDWLGAELGLKTIDDWYEISRSHFHTNQGGGLLANYFGDSVYRALEEYAPKKRWIPWCFNTVPQGFWKDIDNRRSYFRWLGKELGYKKITDWYQLSRKDFTEHHGEALFSTYYKGSIFKALTDFRPNHQWSKEKIKAARK